MSGISVPKNRRAVSPVRCCKAASVRPIAQPSARGVRPSIRPAARRRGGEGGGTPPPQVGHVVLGHGSGGLLTHRMIRDVFLEAFDNPALRRGDDAAVLALEKPGRLALTTDAHIVSPLFFPGGDIGRLAICGTVNDLAVLGAQPRWLTASFILEEGLAMADPPRGGGAMARPGDAVFVSGPLGDHGLAVLAARGQLGFTIEVESDVAPLNGLVEALFASGAEIHVLRGPTPGGLATPLNENARQRAVSITVEEQAIPVRPAVASACELLGFDPLYVANEGRLIVIAAENSAEDVLAGLRAHPPRRGGARIGPG